MVADFSRIGKSNVRRSKVHERKIANDLTNWSGIQFRRRRAEGRGAAVVEIEGAADVIAVGADFHFSVEAKCGKGFSMDALLGSTRTAAFTSWWHQSTYDANIMTESRGRKIYPLLFFRPYTNTNWVAFPRDALMILRPKPGLAHGQPGEPPCLPSVIFDGYGWLGPIDGDVSHSPKHKNIVSIQLDPVIMCRWHDFEDKIDPASAFIAGPI